MAIDGIKRKAEKQPAAKLPQPKKVSSKIVEKDPVFSELINSPALEELHEKFLQTISRKHRKVAENLKKIRSEVKRIEKTSFKEKIKKTFSSLKRKSSRFKKIKITPAAIATILIVTALAIFSIFGASLVKAKTERLSFETKDHINKAFTDINNGDLAGSFIELDTARQKISEIKMLTQSWGQDLSYFRLIPYSDSKLTAQERLLNAAYTISSSLNSINEQLGQLMPSGQAEVAFASQGNGFMLNIAQSQKVILTAIERYSKELQIARNDLITAKTSLDSSMENQVDEAITAIDKTLPGMLFVKSLAENDLVWLSGSDGQPKNILILFQNNAELRGASGGSLGSFGVARFEDSKLVGIDFGKNIFKIDQGFESNNNYIAPPDPIKFLRGNKTWTLKDSGWSVDGADAFKNIELFYQKETGESVDGVFMIDTSAIESLLDVIGPMQVAGYDKVLNSSNFRSELEYEVHSGYFLSDANKAENEPKAIIKDMMPQFLSKLFNGFSDKKISPKIFASLSKSMKQKDIVMYFNNEDFENRIESLNFAGKVTPAVGDYLYLNNSNIDGAKSSLSVSEQVNLKVKINASGEVIDQIDLRRKHNGTNQLPDGLNKNYVRLLLPENSKVTDFEAISGNFQQMYDKGLKDNSLYWIENGYGKNIINFWMSTQPKEQSEALISYKTGYIVNTNGDFIYNLDLQKQPGANSDRICVEINYPEGFSPSNVISADTVNKKISLTFDLTQDKTIKIKFKKQVKWDQ